ncbi:MAG: hypothetical protein V1900_01610 [Candidatus Aenigmatarchaeota archaeon]
MTRMAEILDCYERTYGQKPWVELSYASFDGFQIEKYRTHGIAEAICRFSDARTCLRVEHFIVDAQPLLEIAQPKYAWFSKILPDCVGVAVSSGKQKHEHNAVELNTQEIIEGLEIRFYSDTNRQMPFTVEIVPLYKR